MTQIPPLLHVTELVQTALRPRCAVLHVTLTASHLFSGGAALTKSEELRQLDDALTHRGLPDALSLEGASLDVSTGVFSRSSTVTYRVLVRVVDLARLPVALEVIADAKQATLSYLSWEYPTSAPDDVVAACAKAAAAKAEVLARALGIALGGVHEVREETSAPEPPMLVANLGVTVVPQAIRARSMVTELAGLELGPTRPIGVRVTLSYRVD